MSKLGVEHVFLSARFDSGHREERARQVHEELTKAGIKSCIVKALPGDSFNGQTISGLARMKAMVLICYELWRENLIGILHFP